MSKAVTDLTLTACSTEHSYLNVIVQTMKIAPKSFLYSSILLYVLL